MFGQLLNFPEFLIDVLLLACPLNVAKLIADFGSLELALHDIGDVVQNQPVLFVAQFTRLDLERLVASDDGVGT